jgi:hypothetical protein
MNYVREGSRHPGGDGEVDSRELALNLSGCEILEGLTEMGVRTGLK